MSSTRGLARNLVPALLVSAVMAASCSGAAVGTNTTSTVPAETAPAGTTSMVPATSQTTLRLGITGAFADAQFAHFSDTLAELSNGDMVIEFAEEWAITGTDADVEQQIVGAVTAGDLDLGWVGTRAFAELDVTSFDALTAPFLIDSYALQEAVLGSDIPGRMLAGLEDPQLTGLAVIGGGLRRPIAVAGPLRNPDDFTGITFHGWRSPRNAAAIEALGAEYSGEAGAPRDAGLADGTVDGFENTILFFEGKLELVTTLTANVALWPGTGVLVGNSDRLAALTAEQMDLLRQAVAETVEQSVALANVDADLIDQICSMGGQFALASPDDLEALRVAVQPVYADLAETEETATYIREIEALKAGIPAESPTIPEGCLAP